MVWLEIKTLHLDSPEDPIVASSLSGNHFSLHQLYLHGSWRVELETSQRKSTTRIVIQSVNGSIAW